MIADEKSHLASDIQRESRKEMACFRRFWVKECLKSFRKHFFRRKVLPLSEHASDDVPPLPWPSFLLGEKTKRLTGLLSEARELANTVWSGLPTFAKHFRFPKMFGKYVGLGIVRVGIRLHFISEVGVG